MLVVQTTKVHKKIRMRGNIRVLNNKRKAFAGYKANYTVYTVLQNKCAKHALNSHSREKNEQRSKNNNTNRKKYHVGSLHPKKANNDRRKRFESAIDATSPGRWFHSVEVRGKKE